METRAGAGVLEASGYGVLQLPRAATPLARVAGPCMRTNYLSVLAAAILTTAVAASATAGSAGTTATADNPFAHPSTLPFEMPLFDRIRDSDYLPAFTAGMAEQLREVAAIAADPQPATFENTIVALERSGQLLTRVRLTFSNLNDCNTDPRMEQIDAEMAPRLTAHRDAIHLNAALWARIERVYRERASLNLDPESLQLLLRYHAIFVRAGARLQPAQQARLRELNKRIASLTTRFRQNVLKATQDGAVARRFRGRARGTVA